LADSTDSAEQSPTPDPSAFPTLDPEQIACLAELAEVARFADGEALFEVGEKDFDFFVVREGAVRVVDTTSEPPIQVTVHGPGEFTGDIDLLTGRPTVVSGLAEGETTVYRVPCDRLREVLHEIPELSDLLLEAFQRRRQLLEDSEFDGLRVVGDDSCRHTLHIRELLYKNAVPHTWYDLEEDAGRKHLSELGLSEDDAPVVFRGQDEVLKKPTLLEVADLAGISRDLDPPDGDRWDLVVVGAGPAGLAAAVYGASEGLSTLVLDRTGPGGQAGTSSRIENYMGFPAGLTGAQLATRALLQALKFGTRLAAPVEVEAMECEAPSRHTLRLVGGQTVSARAVLVATGARYRRLDLWALERYDDVGVYYAATSVEARLCRESDVLVVGGGNSAGQAALYLARTARSVKMLLRGDDLGKSMSSYLIDRIEACEEIEVLPHTRIVDAEGGERLERVELSTTDGEVEDGEEPADGERRWVDVAAVFVFVGAEPHSSWLPDGVARDREGFVLTGWAAAHHGAWPLERKPCTLETTCPGVVAAGDVRQGSTKRVAFAVGDGALGVTCVHEVLAHYG
jgi:thioredoxin reductase (NADPH)